MNTSLTPFFRPRGVIVVGAPTAPEKLGYGAARNLVYSGYEGAIHFVSKKRGELFNRPFYWRSYPSVAVNTAWIGIAIFTLVRKYSVQK